MKRRSIYIVIGVAAVFLVAAALYFFRGNFINKADEPTGSAAFSISGGGDHQTSSNFDVTVKINPNGNKIAGIEFGLNFPANMLEVVSSGRGQSWSIDGPIPDESLSTGFIHKLVGSMPTEISGTNDVTVYTITFKPISVGTGQLSFSNLAITQLDGTAISSTSSNAAFTLTSPAAPAPTENNPTPAPASSKQSTTTTTKKPSTKSTASTTTATAPAAPVISDVIFAENAELDSIANKSKGITFTGTSDPSIKINITIQSDPITAATTADTEGKWSYTLDEWLADGSHKITVTSEKDNLKSSEVSSNFVFSSESKKLIALGDSLPDVQIASASVPKPTANTTADSRDGNNTYLYGGIGIGIVAIVGIALFIINRRKRGKEFAYADASSDLAPSSDNTSGNPIETAPFLAPRPENAPEVQNSIISADTDPDANQIAEGRSTEPMTADSTVASAPVEQAVVTPVQEEPLVTETGPVADQNTAENVEVNTAAAPEIEAEPTITNVAQENTSAPAPAPAKTPEENAAPNASMIPTIEHGFRNEPVEEAPQNQATSTPASELTPPPAQENQPQANSTQNNPNNIQ